MNNAQIINSIINAGAAGESGPSVIYGLRFNGVSDSIDGAANNAFAWNQGESIIIRGKIPTQNPSDSALFGFATTLIKINNSPVAGSVSARISGQWAFSAAGSGSSFQFFEYDVYHEYKIRWLNTGYFEFYRDGVVLGTSDQQVTNTTCGSRYLMARSNGGGLLSHFAGDIDLIQIGSRVLNDANNWDGKTINGATRVQSTDNGVTWNPA